MKHFVVNSIHSSQHDNMILISKITSFFFKIKNHNQTYHDGRFYELRITCPNNYPAEPPTVRFISRINMKCVDQKTGFVIHSKLPATKNWNRNSGIGQILSSIRAEMCSDANRRLRQPPDGSTF